MANRLTKIYTRTGDKGTTGLGDGSRVAKTDGRIEAMGTVDELNSCIGVIIACGTPEPVELILTRVQHVLFDLGAELCIPAAVKIKPAHTRQLENWLDELNVTLPPLKEFILPGGDMAAAQCHLARTVCRRAERRLLAWQEEMDHQAEVHEDELEEEDSVYNNESLAYLNRLSDLLFVIARVLARRNGGKEVLWQKYTE